MKKYIVTAITILILNAGVNAQEKYGKTLNLGVGLGYHGYYGAGPAVNANFEFDIFKNFTLAPFITLASYTSYNHWGNPSKPYKDYYYRETIVPVGVKAAYYFDELFEASEKWDFYLGASVGMAFRTVTWEDGYAGDRITGGGFSPLFLALHAGAEVHLNQKVGLYLDLSSGVSTFGIAIHF